MKDPFPNETHRENGPVFYRGSSTGGFIPTLVTFSITNDIDDQLDVALLAHNRFPPQP